MTKGLLSAALQAVIDQTEAYQSGAADPTVSAWVSANAGTGKTHVLTQRVLRLLLSGTAPEKILCLTYTKAAAAEMSKRIFSELAGWVTAPTEAVASTLFKMSGRDATDADVANARTLFTRAIETPGGLKIQTIHAFAERLLQRFPIEAGVSPGFRILDDARTQDLKQSAIAATLHDATDPMRAGKPLAKALRTIVRYTSDNNFDALIDKAFAERAWLDAASRLNPDVINDDFAAADIMLRDLLGVGPDATSASIDAERATLLTSDEIGALCKILSASSSTDIKHNEKLCAAAGAASDGDRARLLSSYLLTGEGEPRRALMSAALQRQHPGLNQSAVAARDRMVSLCNELKALNIVEATTALYRIASEALRHYRRAKASAGALDFDDLITRTANLLGPNGDTAWVLFKLDQGLEHVLVDEAQDTSPDQWRIVKSLADEFFINAASADRLRTVFAVGDEKQSIYSFQGALPEMFAQMGADFAAGAGAARRAWRAIPLNLSFRSIQPVLDAVDGVFADHDRTPGLTAGRDAIRHVARRFGHGGLIELWPVTSPNEGTASAAWQPLKDSAEEEPENLLAERIAKTIRRWLDSGELLTSAGRPIRAGDILILVRKRPPFVVPMIGALKAQDIPVAGADRMRLADQTAIQDLMALGDFLTLPEDDLALACVLKGPLFGFTDDDLMLIAPGRAGSLWTSLLDHARQHATFAAASATLRRWRSKADFTPPFEFFATLLSTDGGRSKFLHRLGPEAADAIDEFLDVAIHFDDRSPPSLTGFLAHLRGGPQDVKRDLDHGRDEVRVMTVHSAKGLEAPIVFLPDTCTTQSGPGGGLFKLRGVIAKAGEPDTVVWAVKDTSALPRIQAAKSAQDALDAQERNRLLYVAMTRARDRLYVCGFQGTRDRPKNCWYDVIEAGLASTLMPVETPEGPALRQTEPHTAGAASSIDRFARASPPLALPDFARRRARAEPSLTVPLTPSRLEPYPHDEKTGEPDAVLPPDPAVPADRMSPRTNGSADRFLRGTLTHALMQHLPGLPLDRRRAAAAAFIERRGTALSANVRASIVAEAFAVMSEPSFAPLFSPSSRAEVAIAAVLPRPRGLSGPDLRLSGQIDRLAVTDLEVLIVDYKTNRPPPRRVDAVAPAYLYQLAAYSLALREVYPGRTCRAALLWTDGPRLMEIPADLLQNYIQRLWELDSASLDAP